MWLDQYRGAVNGIYDEDYLIREVGKKVVYKQVLQ